MTSSNKILLVGNSSFIGRTYADAYSVTAISHKDASLDKALNNYDTIINCAFNPDLRSQPYAEDKDFDTYLARKVSGSAQHLVILSTRAVYGSAGDQAFTEDMPLSAQTTYGKNKVIIEAKCRDLLGDKTTILRLSNIFGFEWPETSARKSFMSQVLSSLKSTNTMSFDIAPQSEKDFLPVTACVSVIHDLAGQQAGGTYNVGAGVSLSMENVTTALKTGYGNSTVEFSSPRIDSFYMNVSKLLQRSISLPQAAEILDSFEEIGRNLAAA